MKAVAIYPEKRKISMIEADRPQLRGPQDVRLQVLEVGICGTDKELASFEYGTPPRGSDHLIIGHEALCRVVEVGDEVERLEVGQLVVPMVRRPCQRADCVTCRAGREDFCYSGEFTERGILGSHGYLTEEVVVDARYLHVVPEQLRDVAVLVEPLSVAEKAVAEVRLVQQRLPSFCRPGAEGGAGGCQQALIIGGGPVGFLAAMALRGAGFAVLVFSRQPAGGPKAQLCERFGARYVSAGECPVRELPERYGQIDLIIEATGASQAALAATRALGTNGVYVFTGVPGRRGPFEVEGDLLLRNMVQHNQVFLGTVSASHDDFQAAIRDLAVFQTIWPEALERLLTGRYPLERYEDLLLSRVSGIKNVISVGG